jgi:predicted permease
MRLMQACYRLLLRLFPRPFRAQFGDDMSAVFADRLSAARRRGTLAATRQFSSMAIDAVQHGLGERHRQRRQGDMLMRILLQDVRLAIRQLRHRPGFAAAAVLTLALGVGANVAMFTVVRALLLSDLPYDDPDRLVRVTMKTPSTPAGDMALSVAAFEALTTRTSVFVATGARDGGGGVTITGLGEPTVVDTGEISVGFQKVVALPPIVGRLFTDADAGDHGGPVLISHRLWTAAFGRDANILGRSIGLHGTPRTVIGVVPDEFDLLQSFRGIDVWVPAVWSAEDRSPASGSYGLTVVARLAPGLTVEDANRLLTEGPAFLPPGSSRSPIQGVVVESLHEHRAAPLRPGLLLLQGASALLFLIACTNLANLLLARTAARQSELGVRAALGAGRGRLIRHLLVEAGVIALGGVAIGAALAYWAVPLLVSTASWTLPRGVDFGVGGIDVSVGLLLGVTGSLVFGFVAAVAVPRASVAVSLRSGQQPTISGTIGVLGSAIVATEVVLVLVLLTATGLLLQSFSRVITQPLGFDARNLSIAEVRPSFEYSAPGRRQAFYRQLEDDLVRRFGPGAVAIGDSLPFTGNTMGPATPLDKSGVYLTFKSVPYRAVTPSYFETFKVPILRGRNFGPGDVAGTELVVIVNEQFVREFGEGRDLLGARLRLGPRDVTVIGIAGDTRSFDLARPPAAAVHWAIAQRPGNRVNVVVRAANLGQATRGIRDAVRTLDPSLPVLGPETVDHRIAVAHAQRRFYVTLIALFASLGVALAAVGIYGLVAHATGLRKREFGIRLALGAPLRAVQTLVVRRGLRPVLVGLVLGVAAAWWTMRLLESNVVFSAQLYQITPHDPWTFAAAGAALLSIAGVACWLPARHASRVDPVTVLKADA